MAISDPTTIKHLGPGKRHSKRVKVKAYKIWTKCHDTARVKREMRELGFHVSIPTLNRWVEAEDWEGREAVQSNEFKRILRTSDDPILRQLVMDDLEYVKVLRALRVVVVKALRRKGTLMPKNSRELIDLLKFLRNERETLLGNVEKKNADRPAPASITINNYDQRKVDFNRRLQALPAGQRNNILDQLGQVVDGEFSEAEEARKHINGKAS